MIWYDFNSWRHFHYILKLMCKWVTVELFKNRKFHMKIPQSGIIQPARVKYNLVVLLQPSGDNFFFLYSTDPGHTDWPGNQDLEIFRRGKYRVIKCTWIWKDFKMRRHWFENRSIPYHWLICWYRERYHFMKQRSSSKMHNFQKCQASNFTSWYVDMSESFHVEESGVSFETEVSPQESSQSIS